MKGHVAPGATVAEVRAQDAQLVLATGPGVRLSRCLRCDGWVRRGCSRNAVMRNSPMPCAAPEPRVPVCPEPEMEAS